jgi:hypothetical protein
MTEREQARNVARRLAMIRYCQEVSGNVAKTCSPLRRRSRGTAHARQ